MFSAVGKGCIIDGILPACITIFSNCSPPRDLRFSEDKTWGFDPYFAIPRAFY